MKRALSIAAVVLFSSLLFGQIHGVPPSVTSVTGKHMVGGPAPSVTSVGPHGWNSPCNSTGCIPNYFTPTINYQNHSVEFGRQFNLGKPQHHHHGPNRGGYYGGYVYSYGVPYPVYVIPEDVYQQQQAQEQQPEAPAPTVFENRPTVQHAPNPTPTEEPANNAAQAEPVHHDMSPVSEEQIPVVLVFKDGHQIEINNYAIVGDTLYELGAYTSHKIKLSDLNLKATIEKNDERGVEFSLPSNFRAG